MPRARPLIHSFNAGEISIDALARIDQEKIGQAAQVQNNILPFTIGKGMMRPGLTYLGQSASNNLPLEIPFLKSVVPVALAGLELTSALLRVWVADALVSRPSVTTTVDPVTSNSGWTVNATGGGSATFGASGLTVVLPNRGGTLTVDQQVSVPVGSQSVMHALRIVVGWGPVIFQIGSTQGASDLLAVTSLDTGTHSLAFTPATTFWIRFQTVSDRNATVTSIAIESAGVMTLPAPWAQSDMPAIQYTQSGDEVFLAMPNWQPRIIQRRGNNSWSLVLYKFTDGPFALPLPQNPGIILTPGASFGNTTLTSSVALFASTDVGSIWSVDSAGNNAVFNLGAQGAVTESIKIFGISPNTNFLVNISGTWVGTITLEQSLEGPDTGFSASTTTYSANQSNVAVTPGSGVNNLDMWFRLNFSTYTSGTAVCQLTWGSAAASNTATAAGDFTGTGIYRVTQYNSATSVNVEVLEYPTSTSPSTSWSRTQWDGTNGWPSAVRFHQGRLWFAGSSFVAGSVSNNFTSFATEEAATDGLLSVTDDSSIQEFIATDGATYNVNWLASSGRLVVGTDGAEISEYADAIDSVITPSTAQIKDSSFVGSTNVPPAIFDKEVFFINRAGNVVYRLGYNSAQSGYDADDLMELNQYLGRGGIRNAYTLSQMAIARDPEPWLFVVRSDGTCLVMLYNVKHSLASWVRITTPGSSGTDQIVSVAAYPGTTTDGQDRVYFWVKRTVNSATVYYREKMCLISEAVGQTTTKMGDAGTFFAGPATTVQAPQLAGCQVIAWGNGVQLGTFTADGSGNVNLGASATNIWVGMAYTGQYQSAKLAYGARDGTALLQSKQVEMLGILSSNILYSGVQYGPDFSDLSTIAPPGYGTTGLPYVSPVIDELAYPFASTWDTDSRVCIQVNPNTPCTLNALVVSIQTNVSG